MIKFKLLLLLSIFLTLNVNAQQARSVKHVHNGKAHAHVLPNNGKGRHSHGRSRANVNRKGRPVKHAHNGKLHWHVLPNNGKGTHRHRGAHNNATANARRPNSQTPEVATTISRKRQVELPKTKPVINYQQKPMYVDASRLNVRNEPNKKGKVVWTLKRDQKVQVTKKDGNWLYIKNSRFTGWVYGTFLTNAPTPKEGNVHDRPKKAVTKFSTDQIKKILIKRSHAYYKGNCPCPYNRTSRGRSCGKRSAYSRPGGASPLCYNSDVTTRMVSAYIARQ